MTAGETRVDSIPITELLHRWRDGEDAALDLLVPMIYDDLRRIADAQLARERNASPSLPATALVHETYLRLAGGADVDWNDRAHFFAVAARVMRRVLVERARKQATAKRDGGERVSLANLDQANPSNPVDLLALDQAMRKLEAIDARKARIVELRYFVGLGIEETAGLLDISPMTVRREWTRAKAWLYRALAEGETVAL
jgi:RNA polymerase sigma factor (TIGR02999 family)